MQINENLHMFLGRDSPLESNCYLILGKKIALVDTGIEPQILINNIKSTGAKINGIDLIVNTHCHFDHICNNSALKKAAKAKLASHKEARQHISTNSDVTRAVFHGVDIEEAEVDVELKEGDKISGFEVIHTPGHTIGSICLFDGKNKILISGDTIFADGAYGRTDLPTGSQSEILKSLKKLQKLDVEKILPGHGVPVLINAKESIDSAIESISASCY